MIHFAYILTRLQKLCWWNENGVVGFKSSCIIHRLPEYVQFVGKSSNQIYFNVSSFFDFFALTSFLCIIGVDRELNSNECMCGLGCNCVFILNHVGKWSLTIFYTIQEMEFAFRFCSSWHWQLQAIVWTWHKAEKLWPWDLKLKTFMWHCRRICEPVWCFCLWIDCMQWTRLVRCQTEPKIN
jgi:hypothetical protein